CRRSRLFWKRSGAPGSLPFQFSPQNNSSCPPLGQAGTCSTTVSPNWIVALFAEYRDSVCRLLVDGQPQDDFPVYPQVRQLEEHAVDLGQDNGLFRQIELLVLPAHAVLAADGQSDGVLVGIEGFDGPLETRPCRADFEGRCLIHG